MKKIEDQAIKAVLRVYSIHIRRQSTLLIASHPARQETCTSWRRYARTYLETTTTATTLATSRVGGSGGDVLDTADSHAGTGKSTEGGLSTGTGGLGTVTTGSTDLDVESVDTELLATGSNILSSQHGSVRRRLVTVSLDLHTTGDTADGFATTQIGDVDEGIVEGGEDTGNAENELAISGQRAESDVLLSGSGLLLGGHCCRAGLWYGIWKREGRKTDPSIDLDRENGWCVPYGPFVDADWMNVESRRRSSESRPQALNVLSILLDSP